MQRILIVDDNDLIRELYRHVFAGLGYEVETAENGHDGLRKVPVFRPECMLIDIEMPGMNGEEFVRKLCEDPAPEWGEIPFVALTGHNRIDASLHCSFRGNASCKAFLSKLTSPGTIARTVKNILARQQ